MDREVLYLQACQIVGIPDEDGQQGYDPARFESVVDENYHCPICMNVLKDPVECRRNEHYFCTPCITKHLQQNSETCPSCREDLTAETLKRPPRIVTRQLSQLNIRCDYFARGCREVVHLADLQTHVISCGFSPVLCSNEGCGIVVNRRDKIYHETEVCELRKVKCHDCVGIRKEIDDIKKDMRDLIQLKEQLNKVSSNQEKIMESLGFITSFLQFNNTKKTIDGDSSTELQESDTASQSSSEEATAQDQAVGYQHVTERADEFMPYRGNFYRRDESRSKWPVKKKSLFFD